MLDGRRAGGAAGASDFLVDQNPTAWSADPVRIRLEEWCMDRESTLALWP